MKCRACQKELPEDSAICGHCGAIQKPYIERTPPPTKSKAKLNRGTIITFISLVLIVVVVLVALPTLREDKKINAIESIRTAIQSMDINNEMNVTIVRQKVENFHRDFPDTPEAAEAKDLFETKMGWVTLPSPSPKPGETPEDELNREQGELLDTVYNKVLSVSPPTLFYNQAYNDVSVSLNWRNKGERTIATIYFIVDALDADGKVLPPQNPDKKQTVLRATGPIEPNPEGDAYPQTFYGVWIGPEAQSVVLKQVFIEYQDRSTLSLDGALLELLQQRGEG